MTNLWLRLHYLRTLSLAQKRFLIEQLGSPEDLFSRSPMEVEALLGSHNLKRKPLSALSLTESSAAADTVASDIACLNYLNAEYLPFTDPRYPALLNTIDDPPLGLFCHGDIALLSRRFISIVGSRNATRTGRLTARRFSSGLCELGFGIVSGLAMGIDAEAHHGALDASGDTVAVIATGIDQVYPARNKILHRSIVESGLVVSEYPPGTPPRRGQFPSRNRIISGLSSATLVVEAGLRSGSLVTARLASEQGREVFAIPGSIYSSGSQGCHYLLKQGAGLAETPDDLVAEIASSDSCLQNASLQQELNRHLLDPDQQRLIDLIDFSPCPVDRLILDSGLTTDKVSSILIQLELRGLVFESIGGYQRLPDIR